MISGKDVQIEKAILSICIRCNSIMILEVLRYLRIDNS